MQEKGNRNEKNYRFINQNSIKITSKNEKSNNLHKENTNKLVLTHLQKKALKTNKVTYIPSVKLPYKQPEDKQLKELFDKKVKDQKEWFSNWNSNLIVRYNEAKNNYRKKKIAKKLYKEVINSKNVFIEKFSKTRVERRLNEIAVKEIPLRKELDYLVQLYTIGYNKKNKHHYLREKVQRCPTKYDIIHINRELTERDIFEDPQMLTEVEREKYFYYLELEARVKQRVNWLIDRLLAANLITLKWEQQRPLPLESKHEKKSTVRKKKKNKENERQIKKKLFWIEQSPLFPQIYEKNKELLVDLAKFSTPGKFLNYIVKEQHRFEQYAYEKEKFGKKDIGKFKKEIEQERFKEFYDIYFNPFLRNREKLLDEQVPVDEQEINYYFYKLKAQYFQIRKDCSILKKKGQESRKELYSNLVEHFKSFRETYYKPNLLKQKYFSIEDLIRIQSPTANNPPFLKFPMLQEQKEFKKFNFKLFRLHLFLTESPSALSYAAEIYRTTFFNNYNYYFWRNASLFTNREKENNSLFLSNKLLFLRKFHRKIISREKEYTFLQKYWYDFNENALIRLPKYLLLRDMTIITDEKQKILQDLFSLFEKVLELLLEYKQYKRWKSKNKPHFFKSKIKIIGEYLEATEKFLVVFKKNYKEGYVPRKIALMMFYVLKSIYFPLLMTGKGQALLKDLSSFDMLAKKLSWNIKEKFKDKVYFLLFKVNLEFKKAFKKYVFFNKLFKTTTVKKKELKGIVLKLRFLLYSLSKK
jgi:hypothetical protein